MSGVSREYVSITSAPNGRVRVFTARGDEVHGLRNLQIAFKPNHQVYAEMDVFVGAVDLEAVPRMIATDPRTGQRKLLRRMEFVDGSTFDVDRMMPERAVAASSEEPGQ